MPARGRVPLLLLALTLAACGPEMRATSAGASRTASTASPVARSAQASPAASDALQEGAAPPELAGRWRRSYEGAPMVVTLHGNGYTVQSAEGTGAGRIEVEGDQITFSNSNRCDGTGIYTWSIEDARLRFTPVNDDPCGRADFLPRASFGRVDP